ncbi:alanine--tRNA ligase [Companilactobacillus sp.]|jgi:alanyl-tRNA synthetase|uniref:alanine--tRNA ligase n=1 Tax=Companilactobacillus sp. TaxID=2767905 RepID=UPI0025B9B84B|nr:alanine--tRNA ligase [Companilactobacillus sp.]MCH4010299.1 alanine--tRNA ligase [Companilactobacillus sp.]MCH4052025.1 alanine--tRNA ligase [Companilactobacillus sp.]MCH4078241.1 alanine--tRNA ligase [Companilactobacillus sp.]MCH4126817.1 alanine--tRNA ligase [Companilactobacillus sp.]MCH4132656.1 alanine--tRNA ligase [Companilactobacillus sp.]
MKNLSSSEIRQMFLDFFQTKGHMIEPSASLVPVDDPTLLWINSGVATLKKYFDGSVVPKNPRITNAQKCIRTNDIENVGKTARHQTFFEMLGNFSVGDYFKKEVIPWAFEFLTSPDWLDMDPEKLYITTYPKDTETQKLWAEVGIDPSHIEKVEDNFWDIGEGPCGPDSEIFYDRGQSFNNLAEDDPENYPGGENERYLEVWNIVFSELNHLPSGKYVEQPHKNIDTGMGLERLVSIMQGTKTNFETDLFMPIIKQVETLSDGKKYDDNDADDISFKIIADHARTVSFAVGDGALPSNEGRGYVIRRLIRRAVLNGKKLGIDGPFLYKLVPTVGKIMESYYPEVSQQQEFISKTIEVEEKRFSETLNDGLKLLNGVIDSLKAKNEKVIDGENAFKLFDTYGFPLEMTVEYAHDEGMSVDEDGFKENMELQRERARQARGDLQSMGMQDETLMEIKTPSEFVGYDNNEIKATLKDIIVNDEIVDSVNMTTGKAQLIFDKTPFYAEMGGQVADIGNIYDENNNQVAEVLDVQHAPNGQNIHLVNVISELDVNKEYTLKINVDFREKVRHNHTATHLLDQALREVVGPRTHQAGSLVEPGYLRFDFNSNEGLNDQQISQLEKIVNEKIWAAIPVKTEVLPIEEAKKKKGAVAMFSEKYGDIVRVVEVDDYSIEFCGGTHVRNTSEIGLFKITSESAVGSGIRRIDAVTGEEAFEYLNDQLNVLKETATNMKVNQLKDVPARAEQLVDEAKKLKRDNQNLKVQLTSQKSAEVFDQVEDINGVKVIANVISADDMSTLRQLADKWKSENKSDVLILGAGSGDKANLVVSVNKAAQDKGLKAGDLIKQIAKEIQGGGGGRPDMAQAGGKDPKGLTKALQLAKDIIKNN